MQVIFCESLTKFWQVVHAGAVADTWNETNHLDTLS